MKRYRTYAAVLLVLFLAVQGAGPFGAVTVSAEEGTEKEALYVAPGAFGIGTLEQPMDLEEAIKTVRAGQTIYLLEGTYPYSHTIKIPEGNDGMQGNYKTLRAYPGAEVVLDFSGQPFGQRGMVLAGNYWHLYGITFYGAGDNGMLLAGDYNRIELCIFDGNKDSGLQISRDNTEDTKVADWPSYNYIVHCTSRNNADPDGEDADGFAPKLTCGEGNVFDGCLSHNNVDDGWDCYAKAETGPIGTVTLINCIAFRNGQTEDGTFTEDSDGNGFKLGGGGLGTPHVVINCLAFENQNCGFTDNNNPSALSLINCTAFNNNLSTKKTDYNVYRCKGANAINLVSYNEVTLKNQFKNLSGNYILYPYKGKWYEITEYGAVDTSKSAQMGKQISKGLTASDFLLAVAPPLGTDFHVYWREADGSLDTKGFAMIAPESAWAKFSTDGLAAGARFGAGAEFVTPTSAEQIKKAAILGERREDVPTPTATATPTVKPTKAPTVTPTVEPTKAATATPTVKPTNTPIPEPTVTETPIPTATAKPTMAPTLPPVVDQPETSEHPMTTMVILGVVACTVIIAAAAGAIVMIWKKN